MIGENAKMKCGFLKVDNSFFQMTIKEINIDDIVCTNIKGQIFMFS
jgi:hypothetical protein